MTEVRIILLKRPPWDDPPHGLIYANDWNLNHAQPARVEWRDESGNWIPCEIIQESAIE